MSKGSKPAESKSEVWAPQQAPLIFGYDESRRLYDKPGSQISPFNPLQLESQQGLTSLARSMVPTLGDPLTSAYTRALGAGDVANNPAIPGLIQGAIRPVTQTLQEQWLPSIRYSHLGGDAGFDSTRRQIGEGLAVGRAADAATDASSRIMSSAYDTGMRTANEAMGMSPQVIQSLMSPYNIMGGVGAEQYGMEQALLSEPGMRLDDYIRRIGQPVMNSTQTAASGGGGTLSGALGAGGLAASLMTKGGPLAWNPYVLGGSLAAGALLSK